jgi:putative ABC transport system permease protein
MRLLRLISWPYARKHLLRWLLTLAGIVLGVGVFVGMHAANQSVLAAFNETVNRIAGEAQLQVTAGEPGFGEEILEKVQNISEVRAAAPVIEATVSTGSGNLLILGVDMVGDRNLRSYDLEGADTAIDDPLVFLARPDSLIVTRTFAEKNHLEMNSRIPMKAMTEDLVFTVRGIMKPGGMASAFGGDLAIMDIYAAQKFFGRGRKFDRIDLALNEGVSLAEGAAKVRAAVGPGFEVDPPSSRGEHFEQTSRMYSIGSNITSVFALFIGMFIIYNTLAVAVSQRRVEIGILRALGATRSQIRNLFLAESAAAGLVGSALGVLFGVALARGIAGYIGGVLFQVYGVAQSVDRVSVSPALIDGALIIGLLTSLIAGVIPAGAAAAVDPVKALQKGRNQVIGDSENRIRYWLALGAALCAVSILLFNRNSILFYGGFVLAVLSAALLSPHLTLVLSRILRPAMAWARPVEGTLAADSLIRCHKRTSGTVAALMLSLSLVIALGGLDRASYLAIAEWVRVALNPDLFVTSAQSLTARTFVFPASLAEGLRTVPGVGEVQAVRTVRVNVKGEPVMLMAVDLASAGRQAKLPAIEGNTGDMYRRTARGEAVMASEGFTGLRGAKLGEILEIPAPRGTLRLPIAGIVRDFSDQQGSLTISRDLFQRVWNDDRANMFRIYLQPGADEALVRRRILEKYGSNQRLFVLTNRDVRDFVTRVTDQWFGLTYIQIAVAVLVAVLGIVNALTVSITDRRRELGVLQAVGGLRRQIRHTIWMEAAAIGLIGLVLGLTLGTVTLYYAVGIARRDLIGIEIGYAYPLRTALYLIPVILAAAWIAALGPGESAVRGSLVEAIEYE